MDQPVFLLLSSLVDRIDIEHISTIYIYICIIYYVYIYMFKL